MMCSRCKQEIPEDDQSLRWVRHFTGRHKKHTTKSERDGSLSDKGGMGNLDYGYAELIPIEV